MEQFLKDTIWEAGAIAKEYFVRGVTATTKTSPVDYLTEADTTVSDFIVSKIHAAYPDHHITSEELSSDINAGARYHWFVDPIDGTRNFLYRFPIWGVMMALQRDGETILSAIYFPMLDELFWADETNAYNDEEVISVSKRSTLERANGSIFRMYSNGGDLYGDYHERYRSIYARFVLDTDVAIRALGCSAALTYIANGSLDFALGNCGLDWDYLPSFHICEKAGARITDSDGNPWKRGRQDYVIANPELHPKVMELFRPSSISN